MHFAAIVRLRLVRAAVILVFRNDIVYLAEASDIFLH
jgi:hypothetical protein